VKFVEVEFKYNAENLSLSKFTEFCLDKKPKKFILASGYDHFYNSTKDKDSFCRLRVGPDSNQLTFKRKTSDLNNFVRTEHNIDMRNNVTMPQVEALCAEFGYTYNTSIFKNCFIYLYDWYTLVFYIVYDAELKELGRFFEIEAKEDYPWKDANEPMEAILVLEKTSKALGISPQSRIKRSLWEMFKK